MELIQDLAYQYGFTVVVGLFIIDKGFNILRGQTRQYLQEMQANTKAIAELQFHIQHLTEKLEIIHDLQEDLNEAKSDIKVLKAMRNHP